MIQIARFSGFSPIIGIASQRNADYLKSLGATHVIDRTLPSGTILAQVRQITPTPVRVVYDTVGFPEAQDLGYDILAPYGTLVTVLPFAVEAHKLTPDKQVELAHGTPFPPEYTALDVELYKILPSLLSRGDVRVRDKCL